MRGPLLSGFCNPTNPKDSHARCAGCGCGCHQQVVTLERGDVLTELAAVVDRLEAEHSGLIDACTDPEATDVAELLYAVQAARITLQRVEAVVENACAHAMLSDQALRDDLRVERYRSNDRKAWKHEEWQRDARAKVLQAHGLKGAQGVVNAEGELVPPDVLYDALAAVQAVHSANGPRTTALKGLGLDPADYCETTRGAWHVKVQRIADDTDQEGAA